MAKDQFGFGTKKQSSPAGPYESLRQKIKKETSGLGGLILTEDKETGEKSFVITYADTEVNMKESGHYEFLQYVGGQLNEDEEMPNVRKIQAMTAKDSKKLNNYVESSMNKLIK